MIQRFEISESRLPHTPRPPIRMNIKRKELRNLHFGRAPVRKPGCPATASAMQKTHIVGKDIYVIVAVPTFSCHRPNRDGCQPARRFALRWKMSRVASRGEIIAEARHPGAAGSISPPPNKRQHNVLAKTKATDFEKPAPILN